MTKIEKLMYQASTVNCSNDELRRNAINGLKNYFSDEDNYTNPDLVINILKRMGHVGGANSAVLESVHFELINDDDVIDIFGHEWFEETFYHFPMPIRDFPDQKELKEAAQFYQKTRQRFLGFYGTPQLGLVIDAFCGNGLNGFYWLLNGATQKVVMVDKEESKNQIKVGELIKGQEYDYVSIKMDIMENAFSQFLEEAKQSHERIALTAIHSCGSLTDRLLYLTVQSEIPVAVMPCCKEFRTGSTYSSEYPEWLLSRIRGIEERKACLDVMRADYMHANGFYVDFVEIPKSVTPENRILIALPKK